MRILSYRFPLINSPSLQVDEAISQTLFPVEMTAQELAWYTLVVKKWEVTVDIDWTLNCKWIDRGYGPSDVDESGSLSASIEIDHPADSERDLFGLSGAFEVGSFDEDCGDATSINGSLSLASRLSCYAGLGIMMPRSITEYEPTATSNARWLRRGELYLPSLSFEVRVLTHSGAGSFYGWRPIFESGSIGDISPIESIVSGGAIAIPLSVRGIIDEGEPAVVDPDQSYYYDFSVACTGEVVLTPLEYRAHDPGDGSGALYGETTGNLLRALYV